VDVETATALERVNERIDRFEVSVRYDIAQLHGSFAELRETVVEQGAALRAELHREIAETRRHAVMLNESTRDDIRLVAEAVANLTVKVDSLSR
jgi:hypothetical protein